MHSQPGPEDIQPVSNEARDRLITGVMTIAPIVVLGLAARQLWEGLLHPSDVIVFAIMCVLSDRGSQPVLAVLAGKTIGR